MTMYLVGEETHAEAHIRRHPHQETGNLGNIMYFYLLSVLCLCGLVWGRPPLPVFGVPGNGLW